MQKEEKNIRSACFIFKSRHDSLLGAFFPASLPAQPALPLGSMRFCPSEQSHGQKYQMLYLKSRDRASRMLPFQPDLIPTQFLKIKPSGVSPSGCPTPHHHSSQPTLPSFPQPPAIVCNRAATISQSSLSLQPHGRKAYRKKKNQTQKGMKKPKERPVSWRGWGRIMS